MSALFGRMLDDAAVFPPGRLSLTEAVPAHLRHRRAAYAELVGPLVLPAGGLEPLGDVVAGLPERLGEGELELAVTVPLPEVAEAVVRAGAIAGARLKVLEVALNARTQPTDAIQALDAALDRRQEVTVFIEVP